MKVTMKARISGTRNGEPWPGIGGSVDLPKDEAEHLIAAGLATAPESKKADVPVEPEKRPARKAEKRG